VKKRIGLAVTTASLVLGVFGAAPASAWSITTRGTVCVKSAPVNGIGYGVCYRTITVTGYRVAVRR
jgi:hypothetical protein